MPRTPDVRAVNRPFRTRPEVNRRLAVLVAAVVFVEFQLNCLNNLLTGIRMALVWSTAGLLVAGIVATIEILKMRRKD
jgi:archaellum biogenesis protein FlaJ (TadC family)